MRTRRIVRIVFVLALLALLFWAGSTDQNDTRPPDVQIIDAVSITAGRK